MAEAFHLTWIGWRAVEARSAPIPSASKHETGKYLTSSIPLVAMTADDKGKGKGKENQGKSGGSTAAVVNVTFGASDVQMIQRYYGAHPVSLPPGLQKKLARGKPLPPGWQKKLQAFPSSIDVRLSPSCGYCGRGVIDGYGVIYDKKTAIILDIVQLAGDILR